ncbi:hypothetical protein TYRP_006402 [Tyrophagus putrescentiae]|nr:hypothetical protein TYRP_006402 [Tyrophagus putrescentiae]
MIINVKFLIDKRKNKFFNYINIVATFYSSHHRLPASLIIASGDHINVIGTEREKKKNNEIDEKVAIDGSFLKYHIAAHQQLPWNDNHLRTLQLSPQTVASVENAFAHFTQLMDAHPQLYGYAVIFAHFYQQLVDCIVRREGGYVELSADCHAQLLTFLQDLGLLPLGRYRSQAGRRRPQLDDDWRAFIGVNPPPPGAVEPLVPDHLVTVPQEQLPLLEGCPPPAADQTARWGRLKTEFLRYQEVYATKEAEHRKFTSFNAERAQSRNRLLKLRAIFLLMDVGPNAADDPDFFLNFDAFSSKPAPSTVDLLVHPDIDGGDDDDDNLKAGRQKRPLEEENDDDHDSVRQWLESGGDPMQMRSMDKESGKRLKKKANAFGLVTLLTFAFIAALIALIWALYSVYGSNFFSQKEGQGDEETTSSTPMTNI